MCFKPSGSHVLLKLLNTEICTDNAAIYLSVCLTFSAFFLCFAAQNVTVEEIISSYKQACQKLNCKPISKVLKQIQVRVDTWVFSYNLLVFYVLDFVELFVVFDRK